MAIAQEKLQAEEIAKSGKILNPRTFDGTKIKYIPMDDWTSGFYPGTMWYMYELTGDSIWKNYARNQTEAIDSVKYLTWHHDVGSIPHGVEIDVPLNYADYYFIEALLRAKKHQKKAEIKQL